MNKTIFLSTYFFLPRKIQTEIIELNKIIDKYFKNMIHFNDSLFRPHITIYFAEFPAKNEQKLIDTVNNIDVHPFRLRINDLNLNDKGYIQFNCNEPHELISLHKKVLKDMNPLRESILRSKYQGYISQYNSEQQQTIKKFGWPYVDKLFSPHVTVARIATEERERAIKFIAENGFNNINYEFMVKEIKLVKSYKSNLSEDLNAKVIAVSRK